jgi:hypothetical protein
MEPLPISHALAYQLARISDPPGPELVETLPAARVLDMPPPEPGHDWNDPLMFKSEDDQPGFSSGDGGPRQLSRAAVDRGVLDRVKRGASLAMPDGSVMHAQRYVRALGGGVGTRSLRGTTVSKFMEASPVADISRATLLAHGKYVICPFADGTVGIGSLASMRLQVGKKMRYEHAVATTQAAWFLCTRWYTDTGNWKFHRFKTCDVRYMEVPSLPLPAHNLVRVRFECGLSEVGVRFE